MHLKLKDQQLNPMYIQRERETISKSHGLPQAEKSTMDMTKKKKEFKHNIKDSPITRE